MKFTIITFFILLTHIFLNLKAEFQFLAFNTTQILVLERR